VKRQKLIFSIVALGLIAGTALLLAAVPQKLGAPGVKASPVPGSDRWQIYLPERVLGFDSTNQEPDENTLTMLPKDTSFGGRLYYRAGCRPIASGVVLMGTDRTSIHKAEYCLQGEGLHIEAATREVVHMDQPQPYDLPVIKIVATGTFMVGGKPTTKRCIYVYWYVADGALSNDRSGFARMWSMARQLVFTGVLQRWAYVRFYGFCDPGEENATFDQIKQMIAASVPQFQLIPKPSGAAMAAQR
jgi:hypothetical protein